MAYQRIIDAVGWDWLSIMALMFGFVVWWAFRKSASRDGDSGGSDTGSSSLWPDDGDSDGGDGGDGGD